MKTGITELAFIIDRSGSMCGLENDTIGGFNSMLEKQRNEPGKAYVTTALFDHEYELLHDRIEIGGVRSITAKDYYVRGNTALLDAIGHTINKLIAVQKNSVPEYKADNVLVVIITDGYENASREFNYNQINALIETQTKQWGWKFIFLGANIDAAKEAGKFGISSENSVNYMPDSEGTKHTYDAVCSAASCMRASRPLTDEWRKSVDEDYMQRKNK